jgi:hypothetical protein
MDYEWSEVVSGRSPASSNALLPTPIMAETDGSVYSNTLTVVPFSASIKTAYVVQLKVTLTNKLISSSQNVLINYIQSPL